MQENCHQIICGIYRPLRDDFLSGILLILSALMIASTLICEALNRPVALLSPETRLDSMPEFDSLVIVGLVVRIETLIDRELSEEEMHGLLTVRDVADLLKG